MIKEKNILFLCEGLNHANFQFNMEESFRKLGYNCIYLVTNLAAYLALKKMTKNMVVLVKRKKCPYYSDVVLKSKEYIEKSLSKELLSGAPGTGRHFALEETARIMAARGLLQSDKTAVLDLALYPDAGSEKLFLQDLYAALHAPGEILIFEHYESCYPGFLKTIADLATRGSAPLSSRYLVNKEGILVDAGTALAPGAVSRIDPCGKYLIFFSHKGREVLADKFGAPFVSAVGDVCTTIAFAREDLAAMAAQELNALAQKVRTRLGLTLTAGADVRDYVAAQCSKEKGAAGLKLCCDRIFRALSEYCLQNDTALTGTVALTAVPEGLQFALNGAAPADLFSLLPTEYTGAVDEIRAELDALVGLAPVKDYVFGLADNLQVQQRRAAAGFKTASLSMHMIFTGNPGTGKTTIARLVAKYLKAIGALKGGQLVEVSRGDLVGRYTGHTAPLTNSVIQSALGGVLFIDEAYALVNQENGNDFGRDFRNIEQLLICKICICFLSSPVFFMKYFSGIIQISRHCDHHRQRSYDNLIFLKYSFHFTSLLFMYHPRFIIFILCASTPNNACTASVRLRATTASPPPSAITITPSTSGVSSLLT